MWVWYASVWLAAKAAGFVGVECEGGVGIAVQTPDWGCHLPVTGAEGNAWWFQADQKWEFGRRAQEKGEKVSQTQRRSQRVGVWLAGTVHRG